MPVTSAFSTPTPQYLISSIAVHSCCTVCAHANENLFCLINSVYKKCLFVGPWTNTSLRYCLFDCAYTPCYAIFCMFVVLSFVYMSRFSVVIFSVFLVAYLHCCLQKSWTKRNKNKKEIVIIMINEGQQSPDHIVFKFFIL